MPDIAIPVIPVTLGSPSSALAAATPAIPTAAGAQTAWGIHAATIFGDITADLLTAQMVSLQWNVNAPTKAVFNVPFDEPNTAELPLAGGFAASASDAPFNREVKIYRNGSLIFWGPCTSRRANTAQRQWQYTAYDPLWYLMRRNMGEANRHNYLSNGSFELPFGGSLDGWDAVGAGMGSGVDDTIYIEGLDGEGHSAVLQDFASEDAYLTQSFAMTSGGQGLALILTAWAHIDSITGPAASSLAAQPAAGIAIIREGAGGGPGEVGVTLLDTSLPVRKWLRFSTAVLMPPNVTETIEVRLHCPKGRIHWDAATVVIEESLSFINLNGPGGDPWDQVVIAQQIVRYASGALPVGDPYNKSGLHIAVDGEPSGVTMERTYQFSDHEPIYQGGGADGALDQFTQSANGFDFRIDLDGPATRTFRTYYPAVGRIWDPDELTLAYVRTFDDDGNPNGRYFGITAVDLQETMEGAANDICVLGGWGSGASREEGASDASFLANMGELSLEQVVSAPSDAPLDLLNTIATGIASELASVLQTPTLTIVEPRDTDPESPTFGEVTVPLIGVLMPGDIVPIDIEDGPSIQLIGSVRTVQVTYDCVAETLSVPIWLGGGRGPADG